MKMFSVNAVAALLLFVLSGTAVSRPVSDKYSSPYMDASGTTLVSLKNGAKVTEETAAYINLPAESSDRASYDQQMIVKVADGIWTLALPSIVNVHVIEGPDGLIVYDTGDSLEEGQQFYRMLRQASDAPIRAIIYSHEHYARGTRAFLDGEAARNNRDIRIVGHSDMNLEMLRTRGAYALYPEIAPVLTARGLQQFNSYLPTEGPDAGFKNSIRPGTDGYVEINTPASDGQKMNLAGLDLVFRTQGIETDTRFQLLAWIPARKAVLNNVIWGWFPNIYSVRGGGFRDPLLWRKAVDEIIALKPEILLSTHSTSLAEPVEINKRLADYRDAFSFILDQTLKFILYGQGPDELRYSVKLPPRLRNAPILIQNYGEVAHMPARIYNAIFGQFDGDAARLNRLHPEDEAHRMVEAMGGKRQLRRRISTSMRAGDYLWACQLADYLVRAANTPANRQMKASCLREMGYRSLATNSRSWYLSQARALEGITPLLVTAPVSQNSIASRPGDFVDYFRIRINVERAANADLFIILRFGDDNEFGLHVRRGLADFVSEPANYARKNADVVVILDPQVWAGIYNNKSDPAALIDDGTIKVSSGTPAAAKQFFAMFDPVYDWQNDPALRAMVANNSLPPPTLGVGLTSLKGGKSPDR